MLTLDGRTAIVTGGASGIGAAVCAALQKEGVRVASLDLQTGGPADLGYECDVSDEASVANAVGAAAKDLGDVHYAFVQRRHRGHGLRADDADGGVGPCHPRSTSAARS